MTAVVAILNKTGMALAADSAATISNGDNSASKVFNTANKVFTLSKYHPISIMIYSDSEFLTTPWEIIIKLYRKELQTKSFNTVKEYSKDFITFLETNPLLNLSDKEKFYLEKISVNTILDTLSALKNHLKNDSKYFQLFLLNELRSDSNLTDEQERSINELAVIFNEIIKKSISNIDNVDDLETLGDIDFESYKNENHEFLTEIINKVITAEANILKSSASFDALKANLFNLIIHILKSNFFDFGRTGLVFLGYGEHQIYPALYAIETDGIIHSKLRYALKEEVIISDENTSALAPFAQTDVMDTFIRGVNSTIHFIIEDSLKKSLSSTLETYNKAIIQNSDGNVDSNYLSTLKGVYENRIVSTMRDDIQSYLQYAHIQPTLQALRFLSKEDLAELAESLIYLTFLKRRTTSSLESVGGAIDVAIISKGDGFIWKNRKHYFEKNLNQHFFKNYFDC